jgi:hypothetical protein
MIPATQNTLNRLVVMHERKRPLPPANERQKVGCVCMSRSAEPARCLTHLQQFDTPRPPRSAELFRDARCKSVGWTPFAGCAFALAASAEIRLPLASMPCTRIVSQWTPEHEHKD